MMMAFAFKKKTYCGEIPVKALLEMLLVVRNIVISTHLWLTENMYIYIYIWYRDLHIWFLVLICIFVFVHQFAISIFPGGWMDADRSMFLPRFPWFAGSRTFCLVTLDEIWVPWHQATSRLVDVGSPWLHLVKPPPSWRQPIVKT